MSNAHGQRKSPRYSPKAEEAFRQYVALGPSRSLRQLADTLVAQKHYKTKATALAIINKWSVEHKWQERLAKAASEAAERMLQEAADLDAETFLRTSREMHHRTGYISAFKLDDIVRTRESVRKPIPKGVPSVNVNVTITPQQREIAERIAASRGVPADDVIAEIEAYLQEQRV